MFKYCHFLVLMSLGFYSFCAIAEDPTRPPSYLLQEEEAFVAQQDAPVLSAIIHSDVEKRAVISGKIYRENEFTDALRVHQINQNNVEVSILSAGNWESEVLMLPGATVIKRISEDAK